jgi:cyclophilin family peptidyl-prolyl cis-trans isomerase
LLDTNRVVRAGAARGAESLLRRTARSSWPRTLLLDALRTALRASSDAETRQLALLGLTAASDRDSATIAVALADTSAQVRRLAVALGRQWVDDPSYLVRFQAMRVAGTCDRAAAALRDVNMHVVLTAVDFMGERKCDAARLDSLVRSGTNWRIQAHALVALAKVDSARTRAALSRVTTSRAWQARAWAAQAARAVGDTVTLAVLARDTAPNVAIAALRTDDDARRALTSTHSGLVLAAATHYKASASARTDAPLMVNALLRLSARNVATNRDPRVALLQRLVESADSTVALRVQPLVRDLDPEVSALAAKLMSERARISTTAAITRYEPAPFPSAATLAALRGATAIISLRGLGTLEIALLPDEAPATVAAIVASAERGAFNGLTWHRIVPNFVLQGGSPGADEYDGVTPTFLRDETGFARHARGSFGISTRGRDTGDGQLFINLVDNFRLDHDYTVFATLLKGLDVMDRVQEGDVIESVRIVRKR